MAVFNIFGSKEVKTETETPITPEEKYLNRLYDVTEKNSQMIGNLEVASIPLELGEIDVTYQRIDTCTEMTINAIASGWDNAKVGLPKVSRHPEEKRYYIVDGIHRWAAAKKVGIDSLTCEILTLSDDPTERRKQEARLFVGQTEGVEQMKPMDQHKAMVLLGIPEHVAVKEIITNTDGVEYKVRNGRGNGKAGQLTGFKRFVNICRVRGKQHGQNIIDALIGAGWNTEKAGFGNQALDMVSNVLLAHKETEVKAEIARVLRDYDPTLFMSVARGAYQKCKPTQAAILYLDDCVCTNLNIPRLIDPKVTERFTPEVA